MAVIAVKVTGHDLWLSLMEPVDLTVGVTVDVTLDVTVDVTAKL